MREGDAMTIDDVISDLNNANNNAIPRALTWMKDHGSSVDLNYGEDTGQWECAWIAGGERHGTSHRIMTSAIVGALLLAKMRTASSTSVCVRGA